MKTEQIAARLRMGYDEGTEVWGGICPACKSLALSLTRGHAMSHLCCLNGCNALKCAYSYDLGVQDLVPGRTFLHISLVLGILNRARADGVHITEQDKGIEMDYFSKYLKATAVEAI
jgi:hypothetical protein